MADINFTFFFSLPPSFLSPYALDFPTHYKRCSRYVVAAAVADTAVVEVEVELVMVARVLVREDGRMDGRTPLHHAFLYSCLAVHGLGSALHLNLHLISPLPPPERTPSLARYFAGHTLGTRCRGPSNCTEETLTVHPFVCSVRFWRAIAFWPESHWPDIRAVEFDNELKNGRASERSAWKFVRLFRKVTFQLWRRRTQHD